MLQAAGVYTTEICLAERRHKCNPKLNSIMLGIIVNGICSIYHELRFITL